MATFNPSVRWVLISLLLLLLVPLVLALGMMMIGTAAGTGMMAQMGGMMGIGMSGGWMGLCVLWTALVSAALIFLIVLVSRGETPPRRAQDKAA